MVSTHIQFGRLHFSLVNELHANKKYLVRIGRKYIPGLHIRNLTFFIEEKYETFTNNTYFYELIPKKQYAQQNMEERALKLILKNITGDDYFIYKS